MIGFYLNGASNQQIKKRRAVIPPMQGTEAFVIEAFAFLIFHDPETPFSVFQKT